MESTILYWAEELSTLEFWEQLLDSFQGLGPLAPILLAMIESFIPALPLVAIVALNVAAHGSLMGFLYSWLGVSVGGSLMFLFWRRVVKRFFWKFASKSQRLQRAQKWVSERDTSALFFLAMLPFTPTAFLHLAFGISDFDERRYIFTLIAGKSVMVGMMALFGQSLVSAMENPFYLIHRPGSHADSRWGRAFCLHCGGGGVPDVFELGHRLWPEGENSVS